MTTFKQSLGALALFLLPGMVSANDIVISQVAPLTGVLASTGKQMVVGGQIYFDHINATGGVNGQKIRLRGKGGEGDPGAPKGDLILTVAVDKHPVFGRDGDNLTVTVPVTPGSTMKVRPVVRATSCTKARMSAFWTFSV